MEDTSLQIHDMRSSEGAKEVARVRQQSRHRQERFQRARRPQRGKTPTQRPQPCGYCGRTGTHEEGSNCPAYGKRCKKCNKLNHFATVCRADTFQKSPKAFEHRHKQFKQKRPIQENSETRTRQLHKRWWRILQTSSTTHQAGQKSKRDQYHGQENNVKDRLC